MSRSTRRPGDSARADISYVTLCGSTPVTCMPRGAPLGVSGEVVNFAGSVTFRREADSGRSVPREGQPSCTSDTRRAAQLPEASKREQPTK